MLKVLAVTAALLLAVMIGALPAMANATSTSARQCGPISSTAPKLADARFEDGPTITQADLVADFDAWTSGMRALNPEISIRADVPSLN